MKKLISIIVLAIVSLNLYSQEMQPVEHKPVNTDYLAKSKKQRTVGWILSGTGSAVIGIGLILSTTVLPGEEAFPGSLLPVPKGVPESHSKAGTALTITGLAMVATGITFLSIAKKNKTKALSMSLINESAQQLQYNTVMNTSVPSVRLRLQF